MRRRMSRLAAMAGLLTVLAAPETAQSQAVEPRSGGLAQAYRTDFAVPDAPAFVLLEVDPSTILRPTTVREVSGAISDFISSGGSISVPRAFAVEFSPGLLIGGRTLTLQKYQANPALYRLRLSAATRRPSNATAATEIAIGVRVNLIDQADLRTNHVYIDTATAIAARVNAVYKQARTRSGPPPKEIELTPDEIAQLEALQAEGRKLWEDKRWNARVLEFAAGFRARSADSLGQGLRSSAVAGWATFGTGFGSWGQLLLGSNVSAVRDTVTGDFSAAGSGSGRFYVGANRYKFFLEVGGAWREGADRWFAGGGGEAEVIGGGWVSFNAGLDTSGGQTDLRTSLAIKLGVQKL